jgi:plastocyanin
LILRIILNFNWRGEAMRSLRRYALLPAILTIGLSCGLSDAGGDDSFAVHANGGRFEPAELVVPAGAAFKVVVTNAGEAAIEFESFELHRERVVQPGDTITVYIPALAPGTYKFFDDFHPDTEGKIVAK